MGESGPFYIHNFPTHSARAGRVREILEVDERFTVTSFKEAQLDITDLRARQVLPGLLAVLKESDDDRVALAYELLFHWDCQASKDAGAPCIYYPFLDRLWARKFMREVLDDPVLNAIPAAAPGLNRFDIENFLTPGSPWMQYESLLYEAFAPRWLTSLIVWLALWVTTAQLGVGEIFIRFISVIACPAKSLGGL